MPSPRASLFRAVYVVYGFRAVFQMSLPPSSSYRLLPVPEGIDGEGLGRRHAGTGQRGINIRKKHNES